MAESQKQGSKPRIGLALAGGGPEGAVYEIGALRALEEAIEGLDLNALHVYVGVSAGAFLSACLANKLTADEMCRALVASEGENPFRPETFFKPAMGEFAHRVTTLPRLLVESVRDYLTHPDDLTLGEALTRMSRGLPVGFFDSEPIRHFLERLFARHDRTDDFRELGRQLVVVASDLDSGKAVRFGQPGFDHIPISHAVQASAALPGLYTPVEIEGRSYVDGVLHKTLHASVALDAGADLLFCINPIVPVDTTEAVKSGIMRRGKLVDRGLPGVMAQTFRTLIRSRLQAGMKAYDTRYEEADVVLLEPRQDDYRMFFTNIFSFSERRAICEHAYERTRKNLLARREELEPILARHGLRVRWDRLETEKAALWGDLETPAPPRRSWWPGGGQRRGGEADVASRLDAALDRLDEHLAERGGSGKVVDLEAHRARRVG